MSNTGQNEDELRELLTEAIGVDLPSGAHKRVMERLSDAKRAAQTGPIDIAAWKTPDPDDTADAEVDGDVDAEADAVQGDGDDDADQGSGREDADEAAGD